MDKCITYWSDRSRYNCTFPAMIADWRAQWSAGTLGEVSPDFPFGYVPVSPANTSPYSEESIPRMSYLTNILPIIC
jgi:hypothetical protein